MTRNRLAVLTFLLSCVVLAGCPGSSKSSDSTGTDTTPAAVRSDSTGTDTTPRRLDSTGTDTTPAARAKRDSLAKAAKKP